MTGADLQAVLDRARISQRQLAEDLELSPQTVNKWVNYGFPIKRVHECAILFVLVRRGVMPP